MAKPAVRRSQPAFSRHFRDRRLLLGMPRTPSSALQHVADQPAGIQRNDYRLCWFFALLAAQLVEPVIDTGWRIVELLSTAVCCRLSMLCCLLSAIGHTTRSLVHDV